MNTQLPGIRSLIQEAWKQVKSRFGLVLSISLFPMIFVGLLILFSFLPIVLGSATQDPADSYNTLLMISGILAVILIPISIYTCLWSGVAMRLAVCSAHKLTFLEAFRSSRKFIWTYFWLSILVSLITALGFIAFIIPGLILMLFVWFSDWILVTGQARGLEAIALSREYVRGIFWKVVWRTLVPLGILVVLSESIVGFAGWYGTNQNLPLLYPLIYVLVTVVSILLTPIIYAYDWQLFSHLKHRAGEVKITAKQRRGFGWIAGGGCALSVVVIVAFISAAVFFIMSSMGVRS